MSNLDKWLNINKKKEKENYINLNEKYFYLNWTKNKPIIKWFNKKPELINYKYIFDFNKFDEKIYIVGNFNFEDDNFIYKENKYNNISYINSLLHLSIKRGNINIAVNSAFHLIKMNLLIFLENILEIMIEDVIIHDSFNIILWFLIIYKNDNKFKIKKKFIKYFLGIVYFLVSTKKKIIFKNIIDDNFDLIEFYNSIESSHPNKNIINSLFFNFEFTQNINFKSLIIKYIIYLSENKCSELFFIKIKPIELIIDNLELKNWIFDAINYNCDENIILEIHKKYGFSEKKIKKIIWHNSIKINFRIKQKKIYEDDYNLINNYLKRIQIYLLQSNF